jgi:S1-C subfamily serine protease
MCRTHPLGRRLNSLLVAAVCLTLGAPATQAGLQRLTSSIVKIYVTIQREDYDQPWQSMQPASGNGSGFVISGQRILSNAHVVSDARFIEVQREGDPRKYEAQVSMIGHDCDLAVLTVKDSRFFAGTRPLPFGKTLPNLDDEVIVLGYPMGGTRISLTKGVVSRLDYSLYSHSGVDAHLVLQVDAAINPGNSGGPVLFNGEVIGLAFQGLANAQNIGYAIPLPVINHFLADIQDGVYHGYPELGVQHWDMRNSALRAELKLSDTQTGVGVAYVDPFGSAAGVLQARDVLMAIDKHPIANDGTIQIDGNAVEFTELIERKQCGDSVRLGVWRNGAAQDIAVPLKSGKDPFMFRFDYGHRPEYCTVGGLVFAPLSRGYLATLGPELNSRAAQHLFYLTQYAKPDGLYTNREQFVVLIARLPAPVNTYAEDYLNQIVAEVNGQPIRRMADLLGAFAQPTNGFHVIRFEGNDSRLVFDAASVTRSERLILQQYMVTAPYYFDAGKEAAP